jgi:methylglutaconyl-CoA hydratase
VSQHLPVWPPRRLTAEQFAAYKRYAHLLRSRAVAETMQCLLARATCRSAKLPAQDSEERTMSTANDTGPVHWNVDARNVARVVLNRPEVNNAYDAALIQGLLTALEKLGAQAGLRAVVITGNGKHFQAGADLSWINAVRRSSPEDNLAASRATGEAVRRLNAAPAPTIALVQGGCFGGGTGLIAACDVVIAADNAMFSIAEVRWGLTAAIIIPQLNDAIGVRQVRRYALTGERFGAAEARRIGLVHEVVPLAELAAAGERMVDHLLANGPQAIAQTKALALASAFGHPDEATFGRLVESHAAKRQSPEAAEGLASFAEKRAANWG